MKWAIFVEILDTKKITTGRAKFDGIIDRVNMFASSYLSVACCIRLHEFL